MFFGDSEFISVFCGLRDLKNKEEREYLVGSWKGLRVTEAV